MSAVGTNTYFWNSTGGGTVTGSGSTVTVSWTIPGTGVVTVIVRDSLNNIRCTASLTVTIHSDPQPVITPSITSGCGSGNGTGSSAAGGQGKGSSCLSACDSDVDRYSTPLDAGSTYVWTITGSANYTATGNKVKVYWTAIGGGTVDVKETNSFGCVGETQICVTVVGRPIAAFSTLPAAVGNVVNVCLNQTIQFIDHSVAGLGSPLYSYAWYFGDGGSALITAPNSGNTTHAYTTPGTYTILLIVENQCHCADTAKVTVVVSSSPGPEIFCVSTVCPGTTVTYHTNAHCGNYSWSVTNGTAIWTNE